MKIYAVLTTSVLISFLCTQHAVSQDSTGIYINPHISYDLTLLPSYIEEDGFEDPFEFNVAGYLSYGVAIGRNYNIGQFEVYFRYGKSILENDVKKDGGLNGEVQFSTYSNIGISFRRNLWQNRESRKFKIQLGYRVSTTFHHFKGYRSFNTNTNDDRIEKYSENIFGIESGLNLNFGSRKEGRKNRVSVLWEPVYFRLQNKGFGFGAQRIGLEIKI